MKRVAMKVMELCPVFNISIDTSNEVYSLYIITNGNHIWNSEAIWCNDEELPEGPMARFPYDFHRTEHPLGHDGRALSRILHIPIDISKSSNEESSWYT
jgi:hypothetical protein